MTYDDHRPQAAAAAHPARPGARLAAGFSLVAMAVAAAVAYGMIHGSLVVADDAAATASNIATHLGLFRLEVALWFVIVAADVTVAVGLWRLFAPAARSLSQLMAWTRIVYAGGLAGGAAFLVAASVGTEPLTQIRHFETIWSLALILFGIHLVLLGVLALRSGFVPRAGAWLLVFAGLCYALIHAHQNLGITLTGTAGLIESILAVPMTLAELWLALWLIATAFGERGRARRAAALTR